MQVEKKITADVLVIGGGLAGLRAAQAAAKTGAKVMIIDKGSCASPEIMGFNAPVHPEDSVAQYILDTCNSAQHINNPALAQTLAQNVCAAIGELETLGLIFDKNEDGSYHALHTLGCKYPRLVHYKALTGIEAVRLVRKNCESLGVEIHESICAVSLLKEEGHVIGALASDARGARVAYIAKAIVLASGGCGAIHPTSTYPRVMTGDGCAMAYRAGAALVDMEFQQFEPCTFVYPPEMRGKVVPTTLLRSGALLLNGNKEEFMSRYGLARENAQKGELSRAMMAEILAGRGTEYGGVYYDMTMMPKDMVVVNHSIFYKPALKAGLDLTKEPAQMIPAAHTNLGGVVINARCETGIPGLFAAGEVTGGLHGANRLGGSSGAETMVFGKIAGESAAQYAQARSIPECAHAVQNSAHILEQRMKGNPGDTEGLRVRIGELMAKKVGIIRTRQALEEAFSEMEENHATLAQMGANTWQEMVAVLRCENMAMLCCMQIKASLERRESRGVFYREDFPQQEDAAWMRNIVFRQQDGKMHMEILVSDGEET